MGDHGGNKAAVARVLNTDATSVAQWLSGSRFPSKPSTLAAIARASGCDLAWLAKADEPAESLAKLKSASGAVLVTPGSSRVVAIDAPDNIARMKSYIAAVDVPVKQVMIEARIMEAGDEFMRSIGISWISGNEPSSGGRSFPYVEDHLTSFGGIASVAPEIGVPGLNTDVLFGTIGKNVKLNMRLNAAASAGQVKIISSPKIATKSGTLAKITQGQRIPYTSATSDKIETKFVEAALSLEVVPHVREDGSISMQVVATNNYPDRSVSVGTPPINIKTASSELVIRDGQTMVIGGIMVEHVNNLLSVQVSNNKTPS